MQSTRTFPFIVGAIRSGTTLLRAMLDAHPDLCIPPESHFPLILLGRRNRYESSTGLNIDLVVQDLFQDPSISRFAVGNWSLDPVTTRTALRSARPSDVPAAIRALFEIKAQEAEKPRYGDKSPTFVSWMPMLAQAFPEARFIHLIRDGRDVACSILDRRAPGWPRGTYASAYAWSRAVQKGREAAAELGTDVVLEVGYESLIADPPIVLQRICDFIELDPRPEMLTGRTEPWLPDGERWQHPNLKEPITSSLRDWRTELSHRNVERFEAMAGPELVATGYELSGQSPAFYRRMVAFLVGAIRDFLGPDGSMKRMRVVATWYGRLARQKLMSGGRS